MSSARKSTMRLFPVNSEHIAVSAVQREDLSNNNPAYPYQVTYEISISKTGAMRARYPSRSNPLVLPNGYFFHEVYGEDPNFYKVSIGNILPGHNIVSGKIINEDLDISIAALLKNSATKNQIVGVSRDRSELFLYSLIMIESKWYVDIKKPTDTTGFSVFKTAARIHSIAGFYCWEQPLIAIALDTRELLLGKIVDRQFTLLTSLAHPNLASLNLYASQQGLLIAHDSLQNKLCMWDLNKEEENIVVYDCPDMCNVNVSIDGKYLTARGLSEKTTTAKSVTELWKESSFYFALMPADLCFMLLQYINFSLNSYDESNIVHCFELNADMEHYQLAFDRPVADFVIGLNNQICIANNIEHPLKDILVAEGLTDQIECPVREFPGTLAQMLLKMEKEKQILEKKPEEKKDDGPKEKKRLLNKVTAFFKGHRPHSKKEDPSDPKHKRTPGL